MGGGWVGICCWGGGGGGVGGFGEPFSGE